MRHLPALALTLAVALPLWAQRGAHAGFAGRSAPSVHASAGFHPAPAGIRSAPNFPGSRPPQAFTRAPVYPRTFTPGVRPSGLPPGRPVAAPMHQPPHGFSPARPNFYHRDRDGRDRHREFANRGLGVYVYPVVSGFTFWPYDDSLDAPYNDQTYNDLSNDGLAPGPPPNEADQYPGNGYPAPPPPGYAQEPAPPPGYAQEPAPVPPSSSPEMQYVPGSADKVTLIFKDGRPPEEIENYLATRSTITVIEGRRHREIRVADLDLPATIKANQETGVGFQLPSSAK